MRRFFCLLYFVFHSIIFYSQENKMNFGVAVDMDFIAFNKIEVAKLEVPMVYNFGVSVLYNQTDKFFFESGLLYSTYAKKITTKNVTTKFSSDYMFKLPLNLNYFVTNKNDVFVGGGVVFVFKPDANDVFESIDNDKMLILKNTTNKEFFINYQVNAGYFFRFDKSKLAMNLSLNFTPVSMDKNNIYYNNQYFDFNMKKVNYSLGIKYFFF